MRMRPLVGLKDSVPILIGNPAAVVSNLDKCSTVSSGKLDNDLVAAVAADGSGASTGRFGGLEPQGQHARKSLHWATPLLGGP